MKLNRFDLEVVPELHEHVNVEKLRDQGSVRSPRLRNPLPKASDSSRGPSPSRRGQGSTDVPVEVHHHQELHVHDDRVQAVAIGVDPADYGR